MKEPAMPPPIYPSNLRVRFNLAELKHQRSFAQKMREHGEVAEAHVETLIEIRKIEKTLATLIDALESKS